MGVNSGGNTDQSAPAPGQPHGQAAPPGPEALRARIIAGVLLIVLGLWMLFCSGLVFADAFESFTDTRAVAAVGLLLALATMATGILCSPLAWAHSRRLPLPVVSVPAAAVIGALLLFNTYGLLLLVPALLLGLPASLLLLHDAQKE